MISDISFPIFSHLATEVFHLGFTFESETGREVISRLAEVVLDPVKGAFFE